MTYKKTIESIDKLNVDQYRVELCWRNRTTKLGKLSVLTGVYHDQESKNLQWRI